MVLYANVT